MKAFLVFFILIYGFSTASAAELKFSVLEGCTNETRNYSFNTKTEIIQLISEIHGETINSEGPFEIKNHKLFLGRSEFSEADEILFQGKIDNSWILIIRDEYNSMSNSIRWLAAFVGHPIQVSDIQLLVVRDRKLVSIYKITKEPSSYNWQVNVFYKSDQYMNRKP